MGQALRICLQLRNRESSFLHNIIAGVAREMRREVIDANSDLLISICKDGVVGEPLLLDLCHKAIIRGKLLKSQL